jgi:hypothetical protein
MKIINGRWVDDNSNPIDERTSPSFVELGRKVQSLYGKNITYNRIKFVKELSSLNNQQEDALCFVFDNNLINKLL